MVVNDFIGIINNKLIGVRSMAVLVRMCADVVVAIVAVTDTNRGCVYKKRFVVVAVDVVGGGI